MAVRQTIKIRPVEEQPIELNGELYKLNPVTKSKLETLAQYAADLAGIDEDDPRFIELIGKQLDVLLDKTGGKSQKDPSKLIVELWNEEGVSQAQLQALVQDIRNAQFPT